MGAVEGAPPAAMGRYQRQSRRDALLLRAGGEPPRRHICAQWSFSVQETQWLMGC